MKVNHVEGMGDNPLVALVARESVDSNGTLHLKINSLLDVSVPPGGTLSIENLPANGGIRLTWVEGFTRLMDALEGYNRPDTTDQTNP